MQEKPVQTLTIIMVYVVSINNLMQRVHFKNEKGKGVGQFDHGVTLDRIVSPSILSNSVDYQIRRDTIWVEQDGAPSYYAAPVRQWFNDNLPGRWIGRGSQVDWAPKIPDLTPLGFFL
ncbi:hypothetical protein ILUMI_03704 [Ignelater luminosus]|uniref:Uncharacterized protein n=1 Tax=Ignelater luminosus TaxID=2038154 RepID=A0A8K0DL94_IGNLU|nr:hypothetical protein ILUMI_03704 [Ignelater luminosus]